MSGFAALMALSQSQTKATESEVKSALLKRQKAEEARKQQQAEQEKQERDMATKLRLQHFEKEKQAGERLKKEEERKKAQEADMQRKIDQQRDALLYGPKKAKSKASGSGSPNWPSSSSGAKERVRKERLAIDEFDDDHKVHSFLTREELREQKLQKELAKTITFAKRSPHATSKSSKANKRLPGGAYDIAASSHSDDTSNLSIKARLAATPNTLTKLNTVKRDTRTIDEILQDRAKAKQKILDGDDARGFNEWFTAPKKGEVLPSKPTVKSSAPVPADTPPSSQASSSKNARASSLPSFSRTEKKDPPRESRFKPVASKPATTSSYPKSNLKNSSLDRGHTVPTSSKSTLISRKRPRSDSLDSEPRSKSATHKRRRSDSYSGSEGSLSPPRSKRRSPPPRRSALGDEIWKLFGKDKSKYVANDVFSDDEEDMEADARLLEMEEKKSARDARKEDDMAKEMERRHEEEKRRRKRERERLH